MYKTDIALKKKLGEFLFFTSFLIEKKKIEDEVIANAKANSKNN